MRTTESVVVAAGPADVFPFVATLDEYPRWMRLVHVVEPVVSVASNEPPAWSVEIRARVGPFARSKRLRMARTLHEPDHVVEFERAEVDGREHARWALRVELAPTTDAKTLITMHLAYDGGLWTGGLLQRVLDDEIRRGREGLARAVSAEPMH